MSLQTIQLIAYRNLGASILNESRLILPDHHLERDTDSPAYPIRLAQVADPNGGGEIFVVIARLRGLIGRLYLICSYFLRFVDSVIFDTAPLIRTLESIACI